MIAVVPAKLAATLTSIWMTESPCWRKPGHLLSRPLPSSLTSRTPCLPPGPHVPLPACTTSTWAVSGGSAGKPAFPSHVKCRNVLLQLFAQLLAPGAEAGTRLAGRVGRWKEFGRPGGVHLRFDRLPTLHRRCILEGPMAVPNKRSATPLGDLLEAD